VATIKVAETAGFDKVAALWDKIGVGTNAHAYPSITLGVFEATPYEIATAYTLFPNGGQIRPLRVLSRVVAGGKTTVPADLPQKKIARPDTTYLVVNMMRSVLNEGTGAGARAGRLRARRRGQDGHDQRPARRVVRRLHAGAADRRLGGPRQQPAARPERLTGRGAHLDAVHGAGAGGPSEPAVRRTAGITTVVIDRDTGKLAGPSCPRLIKESFLSGTEPTEVCDVHKVAGG
jgi:membrane carboxypeptidase/penicillin-binding protein